MVRLQPPQVSPYDLAPWVPCSTALANRLSCSLLRTSAYPMPRLALAFASPQVVSRLTSSNGFETVPDERQTSCNVMKCKDILGRGSKTL